MVDFEENISFRELKIYMPRGDRLPRSLIYMLDESGEVVGSVDTLDHEPDLLKRNGVNLALYRFIADDFNYTRKFYNGR